ncbi:MFS transporter [Marinitoga aeolica]|uniref:MFS transporter n=1 Tax=Marinitoga aeolica TaxID=2809031 RepID=A0ABY8PP26_9BACT|nr:MFS transporter [Marinitoga aeolica]WGS64378.1 MFS transporter [Marinitoga aeolica]
MTHKNEQRLIFITIFFLAIIVNSIPPLMTTLQSNYSISIGISSFIPLSRTVGNIIVSIIGAFIIAILGLRNSILIGLGFEIIGIILFIFSYNVYILIISMFFIGASMGQTILSLISMFDHLPEKYQKYGLLHAFFGFGGIVGPLVISYILKNKLNYKLPFYFYLVTFLFIFLFMVIKKSPENVKYRAFNFLEAFGVLRKKFVLYMITIFILYSGSEIGIVTWSSNLFYNHFHYSKEYASIFISMFWVFFTIGRVLTDFLYNKLKVKITLISALFSAGALSSIFFLGNYSPYIFSFLGILLGPIFPATQKYLNSNLSHREVGLVSGMVSVGIGFGAASITTTMGFIGDYSIIYSYLIPIISFVLVSIISIKVIKLKK